MKNIFKAVIVAAAVMAIGLVSGCGGGGSDSTASSAGAGTPSASPPAGTPSGGAALYQDNCASCHGPLATSSKKGITLARLQNAIANNFGGMSSLSVLTTADQQLIVDALNPGSTPVTPPPTPTPSVDGVALYAADCAGCHGSLATSSKAGRTAAQIQAAISANRGGMGSLSSLTTAQVSAIAAALAPAVTPTPTPVPTVNGATLYASDCAGCHGALATSSKTGRTAAQIQAAISANRGGMGTLSSLTTAQVAAIAAALAPAVTPTPTPVPVFNALSFYNTSCLGCHGTLGPRSAAQITSAIANFSQMSQYRTTGSNPLTAAQITAIAAVSH